MDALCVLLVLFVGFLPDIAWPKKLEFNETCAGDLELGCASGRIIMVKVSHTVRIDEYRCQHGSGENKTSQQIIWSMCNEKKKCVIPFNYKMGDFQYLSVHYDCGTRYGLCGDLTITESDAYLESPKFSKMHEFNPKHICSCEAELESPQDIVVSFKDNSFNTSKAHVTIHWDNTTAVVDEKTEPKDKRNLRNLAQEKFRIAFDAGDEALGGRFQLSYEADQPITLVCNPGTGGGLNMALILIAPIALVCLLILITIIICIVKRTNSSKRKRQGHEAEDVPDGPNSGPTYDMRRGSYSSYSSYCSTCDGHHDHGSQGEEERAGMATL